MKRILYILLALSSILPLGAVAQNFVERTNGTFTPVDPYLAARRAFYLPKVCDTLVDPLHGGKDSVGAIIVDTCNHKVWIRDFANSTKYWRNIGFAYIVANALNQSGDSILLGGPMTKYTFIRGSTNRSEPTGVNGSAIFIGNVPPDTATAIYGIPSQTVPSSFDRGLLYVSRNFYNNDTLLKRYGGTVQAATQVIYDSTNTKFKSSSTPIYLGYGGFNATSRLFPPDTAYVHTSPQGIGSGQAYNGELGIGGINKYYLTVSTFTPDYPLSGVRMGIDFARSNLFVKREVRGIGVAEYISDWKSDQQSINSGTTELGSYINRISGYMAYGTVYPHPESPSKAKTLAVSKVDTCIGFYAKAQWGATNEVNNGYGFVSEGTGDYNFFAGNTKFGGTMPSTANVQTRTVVIDSTVQVGRTTLFGSTSMFHSEHWARDSITPANFTADKRVGVHISTENFFDQNVTSISGSGLKALTGELWLYADSIQSASSNSNGTGLKGANFGMYLRKKPGYADTTTWTGGTIPRNAPAGLTCSFDCSDAGGVGSDNIGLGWFSSFSPNFNLSNLTKFEHCMWINISQGQFVGTTNITNGYGIYIDGFASQVTNKYAIYQAGTLDTVLTNGKLRFNNLAAPPGAYNLLVHGATDSTVYQTVVLLGSGTLDFPSTAAQTSSDLTIAVTGAADRDVIALGVPNASVNANSNFTAWVSAAGVVTVRFNNYSASPIDPASGTFKVRVTK